MKTRKTKPEKRAEPSGLRARRVNLLDRPPPVERAPIPAPALNGERARRSGDGRFEIVAGLDIPPKIQRSAYPIHELKVGECLVIEKDLKVGPTSVRKLGAKLKRKFIVRRLPPPRKGWGVWREE